MSSDRDRKRDAESNELRVRRRPDGSEPAHEEPVAEVVLPTEAEAAALTEPGFASSANLPRKAEAMLGLQQTHGNAYVQRLVAAGRREAEGEPEDEVPPEVAQRIEAARGGGRPLEPETRAEMEAALGRDFGDVRLHTDAGADELSRGLSARAFTTGKDVFFRSGAHDSRSPAGRETLAHELAHVVQQEGGDHHLRGTVSRPGDVDEVEAGRVSAALARGQGPLPDTLNGHAAAALQRAPPATAPKAEAARPREKGIPYQTARVVLEAVMDILEGFGYGAVYEEVKPGVLGRNIAHPSAHTDVPPEHQDALWDFFKAAQGLEPGAGGWLKATGVRRRFWVEAGMKRIRPLLAVVRREAPEAAGVLTDGIHLPVANILALAMREEAQERVSEGGRLLGELVPPELESQEKQVRFAVAQAVSTLRETARLANAMESWKVSEAFRDVLNENPPPGVLAERLRGVPVPVAIGVLNDVLGALNAVMTLSDPAARERMFNERLGSFGVVRGSADLVANAGNILRGVVSVNCLLTAACSKALGYADEAARLIGASRAVSGMIGRVIGVLNIVKGTVSVVHPASTMEERAKGVTEIGVGAAALAGGAAGAALTGMALSLRVNIAIIGAGIEFSRGLIALGLGQCYRRMARDGEEIATYGNNIIAGQVLVLAEKDPEMRAEIQRSVEANEWWLRTMLTSLLKAASTRGGNADPGTYGPLRARFAACGEPPAKGVPIARLIDQARHVLRVISDAFTDWERVLNEATKEAWTEHG